MGILVLGSDLSKIHFCLSTCLREFCNRRLILECSLDQQLWGDAGGRIGLRGNQSCDVVRMKASADPRGGLGTGMAS